MSKRVAIVLLSGFMGGVLLRSFVDFGWAFAGLFIFLGGIFGLLSFSFENKKLALTLVLFLFSAGAGVARYEVKDSREGMEFFEQQVGAKVELEGVVIEEPDERENYVRLIVSVPMKISPFQEQLGTTRSKLREDARVLVYARHYPRFQYGDLVEIRGELKKPKKFSNDFDWPAYLAKDEIYLEMFYPEVKLLVSNQGNKIKGGLLEIKHSFLSALSKVIPEPHSAFMGGLTIGAKQAMPKELQEDFKKTGVIHMVVLSGYNVTLVADTIARSFSFLPGFFGAGLGLLGIVFFAVMTGASATIVRASFMAVLVVLARWTGRIYTITWALFLAAFFMILHNPKILRFDSGFQLSFMATIAMIYLAPIFEEKLKFIPKKFEMRGVVASTVAAQIFVLPLLLYKIGLFSIVSLPVNFLVLIFVPVTMFFGFVTGGVGLFSTVLSVPFGWISYFFLQYELLVVKLFASIPFTSFTVDSFPLWLMVLIYLFYFVVILRVHNSVDKNPLD